MEDVKYYSGSLELDVLNNFIHHMPKTYRKNHNNMFIVMDILLRNTNKAGSTSCHDKCIELGINPYSFNLTKNHPHSPEHIEPTRPWPRPIPHPQQTK